MAPLGAQAQLEARFHAPLDPGSNAVLLAGMNTALQQWTAGGGQAWTSLTAAQAQARWDAAPPRQAATPPLGARFGRPEEVAPVVVFLASDDAAWLTGERVSASGGLH